MTIPPSYPPTPFYRPPLPKAPRSTLAMVLGIVAVAGFFVLIVPVFVAPLAWYFGAAAHREVERAPTRWSGGGEARAGMILGIIGTGLIVVVIVLLLLILVGLVFVSGYDSGYGS
ncbi:MAG: hypothetical protein JWP31_1337 [Aeromicrobium sp.]|nr:hypothetical protein [Aeromicrobium sp.]